MPLGLMPGVRTQGLGWPCREVHHCATHVMLAYWEKIGSIYTALTTKLLTQILIYSANNWSIVGNTTSRWDSERKSECPLDIAHRVWKNVILSNKLTHILPSIFSFWKTIYFRLYGISKTNEVATWIDTNTPEGSSSNLSWCNWCVSG